MSIVVRPIVAKKFAEGGDSSVPVPKCPEDLPFPLTRIMINTLKHLQQKYALCSV